MEAVGAFIDNQRGATMASAMDPLSGNQSSPMGTFFVNTITAIFFVTGLFSMFMASVYESYKIWPVTSFFPNLNFDLVIFFTQAFRTNCPSSRAVGRADHYRNVRGRIRFDANWSFCTTTQHLFLCLCR